ncbi:unnamed protein product [Gulo gulo]|uniref:Uncharacterized protein n=1 Tax=Gulo gulo TaxID=48420 RepID=A0A9X9M6V0_GULGU|nr:unnamed protein product [Gulo gulo]
MHLGKLLITESAGAMRMGITDIYNILTYSRAEKNSPKGGTSS